MTSTSEPGLPAETSRAGAPGARNSDPKQYWRANLRLMAVLLAIWFTASYGLGILLVEPLNAVHIGGFPLGFWFAQQGSIFVFVLLILIYVLAMDRLDQRHGVD